MLAGKGGSENVGGKKQSGRQSSQPSAKADFGYDRFCFDRCEIR
jgi:hypothetical protein